jgi:chromosome segregation ATPase
LEYEIKILTRAGRSVFARGKRSNAHQSAKKRRVETIRPNDKRTGFADSPRHSLFKRRPAEVTQKYYRFRIELKPFEKIVFPVTERQALMDSYQLTALSRQNLDLFLRQRSINDDVRQKLEKLIDLRARAGEIEEKLKTLEAEETAISADQTRLRENIEALTKTPEAKQLIARYIAKANEQETRIEQITKERQSLIADRDRLTRELAAAIRAFEI